MRLRQVWIERVGHTRQNNTNKLFAPGATDIVILEIDLFIGGTEDAIIDSLDISASGTGNDNSSIASVTIIHDLNANGLPETNEPQIGPNQAYFTDDGAISFTGLNQTLKLNTKSSWLVTYKFNTTVNNGDEFTATLDKLEGLGASTGGKIDAQGLPIKSITATCTIPTQPNPTPAPTPSPNPYPNLPTLTVTLNPTNAGTVLINPNQTTFNPGTTAIITAIPSIGYRFGGWSGHITNTNPAIAVTITNNLSLTANFKQLTYTLITSTSKGGAIHITPQQPTYLHGTTVSLTAKPHKHYKFKHWTGNASGTSKTITITMDANKTISAQFKKKDLQDQLSCNATLGNGTIRPVTILANLLLIFAAVATNRLRRHHKRHESLEV